jgi:hypothetical protein
MNNTQYNKKIDSSINNANFGARTDSTAYVSCISTPKSISKDRRPHKKKLIILKQIQLVSLIK